MMKLKTILFDLGGVLIHLNKDECVRRFENLGVSDASRMLDPYLQNGLFLQLENGALNTENFRKALSEHTGKEITHDEIKWGLCGFLEEIPPYKFDYIDCLREKYSVYTYPIPIRMLWSMRTVRSFYPMVVHCRVMWMAFLPVMR